MTPYKDSYEEMEEALEILSDCERKLQNRLDAINMVKELLGEDNET